MQRLNLLLPSDTRRRINVGLLLVQRRRRWTNVKPTLIHHFCARSRWSFQKVSTNFCVQLGVLKGALLKVWSTVKIRRTRVPQNAIVPVGRPMPYSIIILNMRFIPKASLRASSQITASLYILERHLWVKNSKPFALTPTWALACKQTDCFTAGMWKLPDSEYKTFVWLYAMLDQRRRRWADIV